MLGAIFESCDPYYRFSDTLSVTYVVGSAKAYMRRVEDERAGMRSTLESCPEVAAFIGSLTLGHQVPHL